MRSRIGLQVPPDASASVVVIDDQTRAFAELEFDVYVCDSVSFDGWREGFRYPVRKVASESLLRLGARGRALP